MSNVKGKLILYFMTLITLILIVFSIVSTISIKKSVVNEVEKHLISNAKNAEKIILSRNEILFTTLSELANHITHFSENHTLKETLSYLDSALKSSSNFIKIGYAGVDGMLYFIEDGQNEPIRVDIQNRDYFKKTVRGENAIMPPTPSISPSEDGRLIMVYAVPVFNNKKVIGTLVAMAEPWILNDLFEDMKFGKSGYAYITDETGTAISHPDYSRVASRENPINNALHDPAYESVARIIKKALTLDYGAAEYSFSDRELYMGFSKVDGLNWLVVVTADKEEVLSGLIQFQTRFMKFSFSMLLLSLLISYLIGQWVLNKEKIINEKFNKVFENNPALMAIQSYPDMTLVECNEVLVHKLGYDKEEIKKNSHDIFKTQLEELKHSNLYEKGKIIDKETRLIKKSGEAIDCLYSGEIMQLGSETFLLSVAVDITEKKNAERELILAKEKAESASILKGQFLANMSHEIRTPLHAIMGYLKLLSFTPLSEEQKEYFNGANTSSTILLALIEDILDLSKIESGKIHFESISFSLYKLIDDCVKINYPKINEKALTLQVDYPRQMPQFLLGDPHRIMQVLNNLLSNAIKFTKEGAISISVNVISKADSDTPYYTVSVKDTGIGISEKAMKVIFDNFVQADLSTKREYGGTGLGLSISKQLIELMDGTFTAISEEGKGATFSFSLPLHKAIRLEENLKESNISVENLHDLKPIKILLVEDHPVNQKIFEAVLKKYGLKTDVASNGKEAVESLLTKPYDIIFMDCYMPIMDGFEATRHIREMPLDPQPLIVAMTASAMEEDKMKCLEVGMNDYISKPIDFDKIFDVLYLTIKGNAN